MEKHKIIFLDIDGVLNHDLFYMSKRLDKQSDEDKYIGNIDKSKIELLNNLCEKTGAKVVISSTWRLDGLEINRAGLKSVGATFEILDVTETSSHGVRGVEIYHWIRDTKLNIENYAILDDDSDMLLNQAEHFFLVDRYAGLTRNHCYEIKRLFNRELRYH